MVGDEVPVREDDSLETQFRLQQVCDDRLVECEGNWWILCTDWSRIVGHDLASACCNGRLERNQVVVEVVAWVGLVLAPDLTLVIGRFRDWF